MSKRFGNSYDVPKMSPAKRPKLDITKTTVHQVPQRTQSIVNTPIEDLWGDDFDDEVIEEIDFIASQASSQAVNVSVVNINQHEHPKTVKYGVPGPSTSKIPSRVQSSSGRNWPGSRNVPQSQKLASSEKSCNFDDEVPTESQFVRHLVASNNLNSTLRATNRVVTMPDDCKLLELEKLKKENEKLLSDYTVKDGETIFLRKKLGETQMKVEKEKIEKNREVDEQAARYRTEIQVISKEKEKWKTQCDLNSYEMRGLVERIKLLESGAVKLTTPLPSTSDSTTRSRDRQRLSSVKKVTTSENSAQVDLVDYELKTSMQYYPLIDIPSSIFESSLPEKFVVDIQIDEKIGKRNLPILQDEQLGRIFQNPLLVKPIVTIIDDKKLSVDFFLPELASLIQKTESEINSSNSIPIINKIVSTTRELLLNTTVVLKTISTAMQNDDIRDMNDLYLSDFYELQVDYTQSICDSTVWYEKERGIETRRAFATLSYIAKTSTYLNNYVSGKGFLTTTNDPEFEKYSTQMIRYNAWGKKGHEFEFLKMILEFITTVGIVRRTHQFLGLICSIIETLCSVKKTSGFNDPGLSYIARIFKELVFSRPLMQCSMPMIEMLNDFVDSKKVLSSLCSFPNHRDLEFKNGDYQFHPNACVLEVFMEQMKEYEFDNITTINIASLIISFVRTAYVSNRFEWPTDDSHRCGVSLLAFTITILYKCSIINVKKLREKMEKEEAEIKKKRKVNEHFWERLEKRKHIALRTGIMFMSFLSKRDPNFIVNEMEVGDIVTLFLQQIGANEDLTLHKNEEEALALIKSTFEFEKPQRDLNKRKRSALLYNSLSGFTKTPESSSNTVNWTETRGKRRVQENIRTYRTILN